MYNRKSTHKRGRQVRLRIRRDRDILIQVVLWGANERGRHPQVVIIIARYPLHQPNRALRYHLGWPLVFFFDQHLGSQGRHNQNYAHQEQIAQPHKAQRNRVHHQNVPEQDQDGVPEIHAPMGEPNDGL